MKDTLNEADKLDLRLAINEEDKKHLTIISYNPIVNSGFHYTNKKVNTRSVRITKNIVNDFPKKLELFGRD